LDPNIHDTFKPRGGRRRRASLRTLQHRVARIADRFNVDTQRIRTGLILQLEALAEMTQQNALDAHPASVEVKQNWARLAAYISQVINSIGKTYDEAKIDADLEELQRLIAESSKT